MNWKTKAALFRVFDVIPFGTALHFLAQRYVTKTWPRRPADVQALVNVAKRNLADFERLSTTPADDAVFFEIGAGRDLVVPIAMRLLGAGRVVSVDINRLAKLDLVNSAAKSVAALLGLPAPPLETWDDVKTFGVTYLAPFDATDQASIPGHIDAFISNEVMEHVPETALRTILSNVTARVVSGGLSMHSIDYSDHYARDGGVSRYNFLQFSDEQWRRYNPGMHYVNRLRHSQYISAMKEAGLTVVDDDTYSEELPDGLIPAPEFSEFDKDDLRIMRARICAVKRPASHKALR